MLDLLFQEANQGIFAFIGIMVTYALTCVLLHFCGGLLPRDGGRDFAVDGKLSQGKPRGAGFVFILIFAATVFLFLPLDRERSIYVILTVAAMLTGFLDDCSKAPWGEYKKGILDLIISVMLAVTYINFNGTTLSIACFDLQVKLPTVLFGVLVTLLAWVSINVTNCADGVDGLSATLTSITLMSFYFTADSTGMAEDYRYMTLLMVACLLGYLWYNATPSRMMMGDAGSRAMGLFIAVTALKSGYVLLYIPFAILLILDGGLGLVKVALLRFLKIRILKNTRTPLHDHVRKNLGWSNTQTVFKFAILQIVIAFATTWLIR
ncbi:MAG: phospho-N-acetylmuramoyl-pentapeptide-transferase [Lachnospiraceae bacterium]|nr:phospho-N-acetylmuramoyl-pentapeptide-transferase [Lachnospiraceae bacterium]